MINFSGVSFRFKNIIKKVFHGVEKYFGIGGIFSVEVVFYDEESMRQLNNRTRGIDKKTDVLSFPALEIERRFPITPDVLKPENFDGKKYSLGSIVICPEVMSLQAKEYGHSEEREIAFLASHGFLHLLGYDHIEADDEKEMREHQENILKPLGFVR